MLEPIYTISSKRMFDKCPAQYEYRYIRELDSTKLSEALGRGIIFHEQAEDAYTLGKVDVDVAKGYALWVRKHEDLTSISTEFPIEVSLQSLFDHMYPHIEEYRDDIKGKFAGVSDLLATQRDGTNGLVDHKSTLRFYGFPYLYSTEQLYMYYAAYRASMRDGDADISWVCLSRVKVEEDVPYAKARNYMVLYLKRVLGKEVTATFLAGLTKSARRAIISTNVLTSNVQTSTSRLPNKRTSRRPNVSTSTTKSKVFTPDPSPKRITVELNTKKQRPGTLKSIVIRNEKGYITSSIMYSNGTLVHVERSYYIPTPTELQGVCSDFLTYVDDLGGTQQFRRSPNLHCASCPFQGPCEEERRRPLEAPRMTQAEIVERYPTLTPTPPNQEVSRAIQKQASPKSPPILQEIS